MPHGIERARVHGLFTVAQVRRRPALMMRRGEDFDADEPPEPAPVHEALAEVDVHGARRLEAAERAAEP